MRHFFNKKFKIIFFINLLFFSIKAVSKDCFCNDFNKINYGESKTVKKNFIEDFYKDLTGAYNILKESLAVLFNKKCIVPAEQSYVEPSDDARFNNITVFGGHNCYQSVAYGYTFGFALHRYSIYDQAKLGARYFDFRIYPYKGDVKLCHGSCDRLEQKMLKPFFVDFTSLLQVFEELTQFLKDEDQPVLLIKVAGAGVQSIGQEKFEKILKESGLDQYILKPGDWQSYWQESQTAMVPDYGPYGGVAPTPTNTPIAPAWPTLGWMRKNQKRVVLFGYSGEWVHDYAQYIAQPIWDIKKAPFLMHYVGMEINPNEKVKSVVQDMQKGEEEYAKKYGISYYTSYFSVPTTKEGVRDPYQFYRNSIFMRKFSNYLVKNGYLFDNTLYWKGQLPSILAIDSISGSGYKFQGNVYSIAGLANYYNRLRGVIPNN